MGCLPLCAGQEAACKPGVYAMRNLFEDDDVETILLVDAADVFNSLNREAALQNVHFYVHPHCLYSWGDV